LSTDYLKPTDSNIFAGMLGLDATLFDIDSYKRSEDKLPLLLLEPIIDGITPLEYLPKSYIKGTESTFSESLELSVFEYPPPSVDGEPNLNFI
jgi:hypothetical protein